MSAELRSYWRWWRQARPLSEIRGQPASESSCNELASWWRRLRHQSSTWGQRCSNRHCSSFRATAGGRGQMALRRLWSPPRKGKCRAPPISTLPTPLTEVVQAFVVDGTVTGIHCLYRYRLETQQLERGVAMLSGPNPLFALESGKEVPGGYPTYPQASSLLRPLPSPYNTMMVLCLLLF